ncbi:Uncharacterized SAM-binding protein YcdF, DUF218 family [Nakamurella panacisegetis]|uniref:Uncharacterized SAM-binding protein YcdF, DUF218 family n=1 Tax=Nakamurella panacisegetis TaxID=1090615 RepID=A0A1H0T0S8_9ACTN|nr:YdcF family protein [Nakamurella panacisegetis]SDP47692.1 Uncharacterized SAM-binding protein YcdF, DUF218 family [Nakamurella panacisegetis]
MRVLRGVGRYLAGTLLVAALIVAGVVIRIVQTAHVDQRGHADAIVVLGAAQYNGRPSDVFAARLDHAAALYRAGVASHILTIGGGQTGDRVTEGEAGQVYLAEAGIPPSALVAVGTGNDTLVSLRAADALLTRRGWTSVVLVTDPWHAERSRLIARDLGLAVQVSSVSTGPAATAGVEGRYVQRETLGTLFYLLTGGSSGAGSAVL